MASTTGTIAVLDLKVRNGATLAQLDDDPADPLFVADMKAFASHGTPLLSDPRLAVEFRLSLDEHAGLCAMLVDNAGLLALGP